jgi:hypothetical protein
MDRALGRRRPLSVRSHAVARRCLLHRHAAPDRQRLAARRPRVFLHAHRCHRPVSADARKGRLLSHGMGRQRLADRAPRAELLRRQVRAVAAVRPVVRPAGEAGQAADPGVASELHRALLPADRRRRESVRAVVAAPGALGGLVDDVRDDRAPRAKALADFLSAFALARTRVSARGADALGHRLPDRGRAGRARRSRAAGRLPPGPLRASRRRVHRNRHDASGIDPRLRGARRASRRSALSTVVRHRGRHAAFPRARAGQGPRARGSREGQRRRDDLHVWRRHRRRVVAGARPAGACRDPGERYVQADHLG